MIIDIIKESIKIVRERNKIKSLKKEKYKIAKAFNNLYCYKNQYRKYSKRLPGSGAYGLTPEMGNAWMCPTCNGIYESTECSVFTGLQYPA